MKSLQKYTLIYQKSAPLWVIWGLTSLIFWPSTRSLLDQWVGETSGYSHGILILVIVLYLIAHKFSEVLDALNKASPSLLTLPFLLLASLIWSAGYLMDVQVVQWLMLPGLLVLTTLLVFGIRMAMLTTPMLLFFYLAIPVWDYLIPHLQALSVWATTLLLKLFQIPAEINGIDVAVPHGQFRIADGCSGLRYFLVSLTLSLLFGYMYYNCSSLRETLIRRSLLAIWAVTIGIAFNWVRIFLIIYIGYRTKMESSLVEDHETFGWILFAIALLPIFYVANKLCPEQETEALPSPSNSASLFSISLLLDKKVYLGLLALLIGPFSVIILNLIPISTPSHYPIHMPFTIGAWERVSEQEAIQTGRKLLSIHNAPNKRDALTLIRQWQPEYQNTDQDSDLYYINPQQGLAIRVSSRFYFTQSQEAELIFYFNAPFNKDHYRQTKHKKIKTDHGRINNRFLEPRHNRGPNDSDSTHTKLVLFDLYYVGGHITSSKIKAKGLQLLAKLNNRNDAGYLGVAVECREGFNTIEDQKHRDSCHNLRQPIITFINQLINTALMPLIETR